MSGVFGEFREAWIIPRVSDMKSAVSVPHLALLQMTPEESQSSEEEEHEDEDEEEEEEIDEDDHHHRDNRHQQRESSDRYINYFVCDDL